MRVAPVPSAPSPASARTTRRVLPVALSRRVARVLLVGGLVTSLAACGPESPLAKPDEPLPGAVLDAPWLVTSPDGEHVVLQTGPGSKLTASRGQLVCFEVDAFDRETRSGWSVVVRGRLEEVTELDRSFAEVEQLA